jgi:dipeptidyl aminopeptidase/acylaminoacyl peptidase
MKSIFGLILCVLCGRSFSAEPTYWQDIRPVLRKHCTVCHSARNAGDADLSGGLALDSYEAVRKGGKTTVVKPGHGDESLLVTILRHSKKDRRMPRDADPLPDETVALLKAWIDGGAKEGVRPVEADTAVTSPVARRVARNLDVILPTKLKLQFALPVGPLSPVAAVAYSPDGALLAAGSYGRVSLWDTREARPLRAITHVLGAVNDLKFSPDGTILAVAGGQPSARGDLRLFDAKTGQLLANLGGHADVVACVAFSPDGKTLASASFDKTVRLWDVPTHQLKRSLTGHSDFVYSVAFGPKGDWLVSASKDRTVRLTHAATGASKLTFSGMDNDVLAVAVNPDGTQVVSSGYEPGLFWWNPQTGERTRKLNGHDVAVHELAFDKAGKLLASAGGDRTVRLWNGSSGEPLRTLPASSMVYAVALRPDGAQVAAGCFDGLVRIFETASGRQLLTIAHVPADGDAVEWLALTPEGYVAGSEPTLSRGRWLGAAAPTWATLKQPAQVARAWRGEKLTDPVLPTGK